MEQSNELVTAGLVGGGAARVVVVATGVGRGAGGARIPELAPPLVFPLPSDLKKIGELGEKEEGFFSRTVLHEQ